VTRVTTLVSTERERLLACSEPECPVQVVVMLPSARAWHRHRGGVLHEMHEVYPARDDTDGVGGRGPIEDAG
jgi:hypothetical protein